MNKKKILSGILAAALVLSLSTTIAMAAGHGSRRSDTNRSCPARICSYIDADDDGICDNCDTIRPHKRHFIDKNQDGICDHAATGGGHHHGRRNGCRK